MPWQMTSQIPIEDGFSKSILEQFPQVALQYPKMPFSLQQILDIVFKSDCHSNDSSNILRACTKTTLLLSTKVEGLYWRAVFHIEKTASLRSIELVRGCRQQIHAQSPDIYANMPDSLYGIRMK